MAQASFHQSGFLSGQWSLSAQGRSDLPFYRMALNVCQNFVVTEEGALTRRSGTQFIVPTRGRTAAKLLPFTPESDIPLTLEFTSGILRFLSGSAPLYTSHQPTISASTLTSGFLVITVSSATGLAVGTDVMVYAPATAATATDYSKIGPFKNRVLRITVVSGTTITLGDDLGNALSGFTMGTNDLNGCVVFPIFTLTTSWTTSLPNLRIVQVNLDATSDVGYILHATVAPQILTMTTAPLGDADAVLTLTAATFNDGPYLDAQGTLATPETGTVSGYSGSITFTPATTNFSSTDVGRLIRLLSEPAAYASGTTYAAGNVVQYPAGQASYWTSLISSNTGNTPGQLVTSGSTQTFAWAPNPNAAQWAWGKITAQATTSCTVSLTTDLVSANGTTVTQWRLGVFKSGQYPQVGIFHKGRIGLAGALPNRFDLSMANGINSDGSVQFSPTDIYGNVFDNHGISETFNASDNNTVNWLMPDRQGILVGTLTGEWLIGTLDGSGELSPTNIDINKVNKYGSYFAEPVETGMSLVFVQRYQRRVMEFLADAFTQRFSARHLNQYAKDLTANGVVELAYQEEPVPVVWARMADGSLAGCTYRRISRFLTEPPVAEGWHEQLLGGDYAGDLQRLVVSMATQPSTDANESPGDLLYLCSSDVNAANHFIEVVRPLLEPI